MNERSLTLFSSKDNIKSSLQISETSLKWLTVAMPLLETRERDKRKTGERLARDMRWSYQLWPNID